MQQEQINHLIEKYLAGTATGEEREALLSWYRSQQPGRVEWETDNPFEEEQVRDRILGKVQAHIQSGKGNPVIVMKRRYRLAAAAVVVIMASAAGYFWWKAAAPAIRMMASTEMPGPDRFRDDVAPGSNKAVLTLDNGAAIVLDNQHNGIIAREGAAAVHKVKDGQLVYQAAGSVTENIAFNTIATPRGGKYELTLPDGSRVWLNSSTSIRFPTRFTGAARAVELSGEAYFEVAKNKSMPFTVKVNDMEVEVLGTHFNVNGYPNESSVRTTLLEGSVKIVQGDMSRMITPGQQASVTPGVQKDIDIIEQADIEQVMAWKEGMFVFNNTDLKSIMRQLERWYDVEVAFEQMPARRFNGMISRNVTLSQVLKMMEVTSNLRFRIEKRRIMMEP